MKKNIYFTIIMMALLQGVNAQIVPQQVSSHEALEAAIGALQINTRNVSTGRVEVKTMSDQRGNAVLYEVMTDSAAVLLSGSKACIPVLGIRYNPNISIVDNYEDLPCNMKAFIDDYIAQIEACFDNDTITLFHQSDWTSLCNGEALPQRSRTSVSPLINTHWDQSGCNDSYTVGYEYYTPSGNGCSHCLAGCVPVAMAQVMNYWQYPVLNSNQTEQFDWCQMPNELYYYNNNSFETQRNAVARLLADCGDQSGASYGCDGTGADSDDAKDALVDYFMYSSNAKYRRKIFYIGNWTQMLKDQLNSGFPIIYGGYGSGGHSFVCDGYDANDNFHINWGWGGSYDGYYSLNDLTPGTSNYNNFQDAIVDIYPSTYQDMCYSVLALDSFYTKFYQTHSTSYLPYSVTPQTMTILTSAAVSSPASWRTIPYGAVAKYQAHIEINLEDGFEAEAGSEFEAEIVFCGKCDDWRGRMSTGEPSSDDSSVIHETKQITDKTAVDFHDLFPNPTDGELTMNVEGTVESIVVYNLQGQPVGGWHMLAVSDGSVTIDVRPLRSGTYLLCVRTTDGKVTTGRFVRK